MADNYLERHQSEYEQRKAAGRHTVNYQELRLMRVNVFKDTVDKAAEGCYTNRFGDKVTFPIMDGNTDGTVFYSDSNAVKSDSDASSQEPTKISVNNIDCLVAAKYLVDSGFRPAVLNMASSQNPGGGVTSGSGAQEENLFRRSTLHRSMYQFAEYASMYGLQKSASQYPLDTRNGAVYTPDVYIFRDTEDNKYRYLDTPFHISVITVAGIRDPRLDVNGQMGAADAELTAHKVRTILRIGLSNGNDALVLGALGCGAFGNPPEQVAEIFKAVLTEEEFKNRYKRIIFAIIDDHNAYRAHNPKGNYMPFKTVFTNKI